MIRAEVHSDDHLWRASFDATAWFKQAGELDVVGLAEGGWGGDYNGDRVAEFMDGKDAGVTEVFKFKDKTKVQGFKCYVSPEDACRWLKAERPVTWQKLLAQELAEADEAEQKVSDTPYYQEKWGS